MPINLLLEVSPVDATGAITTFRLASAYATRDGLQFGDGYRWLPLITKQPARDISWASDGELQETSTSWEPVVFNMAPDFENDSWPNLYNWQGAPCRMWRGNMGDPFASYTKIYEGTCGSISRNGLSGELPLLGTDFSLDKNLLTSAYAGTDASGGMEGQAGARGILKPLVVGTCLNVEPIKIDPINLVFQYHGYGPTQAVDAVYENALSLGAPVSTVSTYADLAALTLAEGTWAAAPAIGAFRLGSSPAGKITADVRGALASDGSYPTTVGAVLKLLVVRAGLSASSVASSLANRPESWRVYLTEQSTLQEQVLSALLAVGCASVPTASGQFAALDYYDLKTPLVLDASQSGGAIIRDYSQLAVAPPVYRVVVSGERNWSAHTEQEVSQAVAIISADSEASAAAARAALEAANQAQADADTQKLRIDDILSDGILDRSEKAVQVARYDSESAQFNELYTKASSFNVATERASLNTTWNALTTYLNGLSPRFRDLTQSTAIDSTYATKWRDYELAKVTLLRAMSGSAATTATWGGVTGANRPADNATVGATVGTNLTNANGTSINTLEDGATKGAPVGTNVGSIPVADLVGKLTNLDNGGFTDTTAPGPPTGLTVNSTLSDAGVTYNASWNAVSAGDLAGYVIAIKEGAGNYVEFTTTSNTYSRTALTRNTSYTAKVLAYDKAGNRSGFSAEVAITTARDTVAPAVPTALAVSTTYNSAFITWTNASDSDLAAVEVWSSTTNNSASAAKISTVSVRPGAPGSYTATALAQATTSYVFLKSVDTSGNASAFSAALTVTTAGGIAVSDFSSGLSPIRTMTSLPAAAGYTGASVVFFNGELYRYASGAWTKAVNFDDVGGANKPANGATKNLVSYSASAPASPTDGDIWIDTSVNPQVTRSRVSGAWVIGANVVTNTNQVTDGANLGGTATWTGVSGTGKPANNATVGAPEGTYVGGTLAQTVETWAADPATRVNNNTVTINGGKITAGTVDTNQLKAGAVTTGVLRVGSMTELNPDPGFRDVTYWENNGAAANGQLGTSAGSTPGWYNSHGTDINDIMGTTHYCMLWEAYFKSSGRQHLISARRNGIKGGFTYQLSALGRNASNQGINVLCRMYDTNGSQVGDANLSWAPNEHLNKRTQFVAPRSAVTYHFYVYNDGGSTFAGNTQIADLQVLEAAAGTSILNGAITTNHMTADTIDAKVIKSRTIVANQVASKTLTANEVQAGTLTAAEIATGSLSARVIAVGDGDSIIPDSNFQDAAWWNGGYPDSRYTVEESSFNKFRRVLAIRPGGGIDNYSTFFPVEIGATYRITMGIDLDGAFSGNVRPMIHMPGYAWYGLKNGYGIDPGDTNQGYTAAGTSLYTEWTFTNASGLDQRQWQVRINGSWTGTVRFALRIVRVGDATLIKEGAIETRHITVNTLDGDRIRADSLDANRVRANTVLAGSVQVGSTPLSTVADGAVNSANNNWYCPDARFYSFAGNKIIKQFQNGWDTNAYTREKFTGACVMSGKLVSDGTFMGICDNQANGNYGLINYAWHRSGDGNTYIFESGNLIQPIGSNASVGADTVNFSVVYDGRTVRYYRNEFLHREVGVGANRQFTGAIGIAPPGSYVAYASFQPGNDNSLSRTDPASQINAFTTTINPGKILIQGGTTLDSWRDQTEIRGGAIRTGSVSANKLNINAQTLSSVGLNFRYEGGRLYWSEGHIFYTDDAGNAAAPYIPGGSIVWQGGSYNYLIWDKGAGGFRQTVDSWEPSLSANSTSVVIVSWRNGSDFVAHFGGTIITGDRIVTRTIDADRLNVGSLSAITANIGLLRTATSGARQEIEGNQTRVYDGNGTLRVRFGVW